MQDQLQDNDSTNNPRHSEQDLGATAIPETLSENPIELSLVNLSK